MGADPDDFGVLVVQPDQISTKEDKDQRQNNRTDHTDSAGARAVCLCHIRPAFAQRLSHQGGGRDGECLTGHEGECLNVHADLVGRIGGCAERRNCFGEDDHAGAHQQLFDHRRDTDSQHIAQRCPVRFKPTPEFQLEESIAFEKQVERDNKCDELSDNGCQRCTCDVHFREAEVAVDQQPVETDVDEVGDQVIDHTGAGVTDAAQ